MNKEIRKNNQGSSLMFVIVAVAFVAILSTIVLRITLINVTTKSIDRKMQKNEYSTETVMDQVTIAIQNISAEQLRATYSEMLGNYTSQVTSGSEEESSMQKKFAKSYLNHLIGELSGDSSLKMLPDGTLEGIKYKQSVIRDKYNDLFQKEMKGKSEDTYLENKSDECNMELHYDSLNANADNYLLLKNIRVKYKDKDGNYSTTISTDIKLSVPKINFEGGNIYPDFTKFCLIGDEQVEVCSGSSDAYGIGNVYAGEFGINVLGKANFGGSSAKIITREDVKVNKGGSLILGSSTNPVSVWAENYKTMPNSSGGDAVANLEVYGDSYVHDDLSLDASYSRAKFDWGNYYGYTFNKDNTIDSKTTVDSGYSSAILINGKNSSLAMEDNMTSILLGGRAFISRNSERNTLGDENVDGKDIMMGQSLAVKSDETFMLVDKSYLNDGYSNPMPASAYEEVIKKKPIMENPIPNALKKYLNTTTPVTTYFYSVTGSQDAMVYFYYNFRSQNAADSFFKNLSLSEVKKKAWNSDYLRFDKSLDMNGIQISSKLALFNFGNMYTSYKSEDTKEIVENSLITPGITSDTDDFYKDRSIQMSAEYKSYQTKLNASDAGNYNTSAEAENEDDSGFNLKNKDKKRIFDELMTYDGTRKDYAFAADAKADAISGTSNNGFETLRDNVRIKCVGVDINGDTNKEVYAVFVVDTGITVSHGTTLNSETTVNMTEILKKMREKYGFPSDGTVILASNCNINIDESVEGLVISAYRAQLSGTSIGATAQSAKLQAMFTAQKKREADPNLSNAEKFMTYFKCFSTLNFTSEQEDTNINIIRNVSYVNWKKNEE